MNQGSTQTRTVVVERDFAEPPAKVWRAITQPDLIAEWLMKNDFAPVVGHHFTLSGDWGAAECEVLAVEPNQKLSYTWAAYGLESVVTYTLTSSGTGTHLRLEQSGFGPDQDRAFHGAQAGWKQFLTTLQDVAARA